MVPLAVAAPVLEVPPVAVSQGKPLVVLVDTVYDAPDGVDATETVCAAGAVPPAS